MQTAVTAYLSSEQLLLFVFARYISVCCHWYQCLVQKKTAVTAYFSSGQLLLLSSHDIFKYGVIDTSI